jgi:hypothetical protein
MHKEIAVRAVRRLRCLGGLLLAGAFACAAGGCLSLGGRTTTYMQTSPETEARIKGLETRVAALEQAATTRAAPSLQYESGAQILSQSGPSQPSYGPDAQARGGPADR